MKCKKKKILHISVSAYIYYIYYMSEFHPGRPCELHISLFFLHTALWLDSLSVLSPNRLLGAHFSYLLASAIIGLQLGEDPMSLLQHGANLVPHSCLCLRGLGI